MQIQQDFDLNVEKILENWEICHAVREIIANALDEQILTNTDDISIFKDDHGRWHVVDYGRGLNYHHLTQNENDEKLRNDKLIGRFGVGLKDALATFYRHNVKVTISSKYGIITLKQMVKSGFDDIVTLHAHIENPNDPNMTGTDFCLDGCSDDDIEKAKAFFLRFSGEIILEETDYGTVLENDGICANIYINGVKVAEESNFLFSYNITQINAKMRRALNRERMAVGRTAYTDSVKKILSSCESDNVINKLMFDLQKFSEGTKHDELNWIDIIEYAVEKLSKKQSNAVFATVDELRNSPDIIDEIKQHNNSVIVVPSNVVDRINDRNRYSSDEDKITTTSQFLINEQKHFVPTIIDPSSFAPYELDVYNKTDEILNLIGGKPKQVRSIAIVDKIYDFKASGFDVEGLWQPDERRILIKRILLSDPIEYAGTLLHECIHVITGAPDVNRYFESALTKMIGDLVCCIIPFD